jgi:hypothetical protein
MGGKGIRQTGDATAVSPAHSAQAALRIPDDSTRISKTRSCETFTRFGAMMESKRRRLWLIVSAALSVAILVLVIALRENRPSTEYQEYRAWAATFQTHDWTLSEDTTLDFADSNCHFIINGADPGWKIQNADHLKATAAVFMAYCPLAIESYLKYVDGDDRYNEYATTTDLIRDKIATR